MSFFSWRDIDLFAGNIKTGTITKIDKTAKTADVEGIGTGIPVHYHCNPEDVTNDGSDINGSYPGEMDEKGITAFSVGSVAAILFRKTGNQEPIVIGFAEEDRQCCIYKFKVFGPDCSTDSEGGSGEVGAAEDAGGYTGGSALAENVFFTVYGPNKESVPLEDPAEYDEDEQCWSFIPKPATDALYDCSEPFWVQIFSPGYKPSQYSGRVEEEDRWSQGDLISADGTIYEEYLTCYEAEEGEYWEDWSEGICGKHTWNSCAVYARTTPHAETDAVKVYGSCLASESVSDEAVTDYSSGSVNASLNVSDNMAILTASAQFSGSMGGAVASSGIGYYKDSTYGEWDGNLPGIASNNKIAINLIDFYSNYSGIATVYIELTLVGYLTGSDYNSYLSFYIKYDDSSGTHGKDVDDGGANAIWIGDDIVKNKPYIIDVASIVEERGSSLDLNRPLNSIFFSIYIVSENPSGSASASLAIDYIHFKYWEDWRNWNNLEETSPEITTNHDWHVYSNIEGRVPFSIIDNRLFYSVTTTVWGSEMDSVNDGMWLQDEEDIGIDISGGAEGSTLEVYIKIEGDAVISAGGSWFYNYLFIMDDANTRFFICFNGNNTKFISGSWYMDSHGRWYISLPEATLTNFKMEYDGTVPIVLPSAFSGKISMVSIETGYDQLISSQFYLSFIDFRFSVS